MTNFLSTDSISLWSPHSECTRVAYPFIACSLFGSFSCFFFQAEDGIRDKLVTGVQTCALPISDYLPTLETIESALPSQLEVIAALAKSGDWNAVKLRLENEVRPLEALTSAMVLNADREVGQSRAEALQNIRRAQRRILIFVPASALLTLLFAAFLGVAITN